MGRGSVLRALGILLHLMRLHICSMSEDLGFYRLDICVTFSDSFKKEKSLTANFVDLSLRFLNYYFSFLYVNLAV